MDVCADAHNKLRVSAAVPGVGREQRVNQPMSRWTGALLPKESKIPIAFQCV